MNCTEFENVVVAIARDEVIEAAAHREGLAHADNCARCARRLASGITLSEAMAAVIADDGAKQAPPYVSKMLLEGFRERKIAGRRRRVVWIRRSITGAVAAMLLIGSAIMLRKAAETPHNHGTVAAPVDGELSGVADTGDEVTTDFIPLNYDPAPAGTTSVVRVQLPRTALIAFGLPVNEDRTEDVIQADLLLDEDGLTRAVRFVE
jgi:hypothetical protein